MSNAKNGQKLIIIGGVTFLTSFVGFTSLYLPFYSQAAKDAAATRKQQASEAGTAAGGTRGSMWSNMNKAAKDDAVTDRS